MGYQSVMLEVDNSLLVDMVLDKANGGVKLHTGLDELCSMRRWNWDLQVLHTYREGNKCANLLASLGFNMFYGCYVL